MNIFVDKSGKYVLWQRPNIVLTGWIICALFSRFFANSSLQTGIHDLGQAFLFTWAYLEVFQGVNCFRRLLGLIVILNIIFSLFTQ